MPLHFKPQADFYFRIFLLGTGSLVFFCGIVGFLWKWSGYETGVGDAITQPVPFSHRHHVAQLGIDCRYCHTTVETSASAGMPPMHTCMSCHSQIWTDAKMLKPVQDSLKSGDPVRWNRVYRVPRYVYFNHSIHLKKGIGCSDCHGAIDAMPLTVKARTFYMRDCLNCHRSPQEFMRPQDELFNLHWKASSESLNDRPWIKDYEIDSSRMTDCTTCHR
jgi:hypothetical protein